MLDEENLTRQYINCAFEKNGITLKNILEITTMDLLIEFSKIGLGIACVIREFVQEELSLGLLQEVNLGLTFPQRTVGFACKKDEFTPSHNRKLSRKDRIGKIFFAVQCLYVSVSKLTCRPAAVRELISYGLLRALHSRNPDRHSHSGVYSKYAQWIRHGTSYPLSALIVFKITITKIEI